jgi:hypothetical protein
MLGNTTAIQRETPMISRSENVAALAGLNRRQLDRQRAWSRRQADMPLTI